ncbi:MAG: sulfate reduction electron transfer complex DsrMKJOP subunit DsrO [Thermodesulfobacteriota bacterium]
MGVKRREFLKLAGLTVAAVGATPAAHILLGGAGEAAAEEKAAPAVLSAGRHWAMVVDTRKLTHEDIELAVRACHQTHNVPDIRLPNGEKDLRHEVKWVWADEFENVFPEQYTPNQPEFLKDKEFLVLCNHCDNPPCCRVCPTQATYKREDGIVVMDMHRCIGCRFCMAGCPYGSRSFNWGDPRIFFKDGRPSNPAYPTRMKGVVEKCNFCAERLAQGQYPACVEACESGALAFGDLSSPSSEVNRLIRENYTIRRKPSLGTGPNIFYLV